MQFPLSSPPTATLSPTHTQKYARMDQSLFTRFVRLGVPYLQLDAQGRSRPAIADLYTWRYRTLRNLDHVSTLPWFTAANPGLALTHQLINVPDVDGVGETEPMPYFFQVCGCVGREARGVLWSAVPSFAMVAVDQHLSVALSLAEAARRGHSLCCCFGTPSPTNHT